MPVVRDKQKRSDLRKALYEKLDAEGESLATVVKALRKMLSQDQATFSEYVGISLATLRKIEQNRGNVTMASINRILDRFALQLLVKTRKKN